MYKRIDKFQSGKTTYVCGTCGITTRETGEGESGCELCAACFTIAGLDNEYNDNGTKPSVAEESMLLKMLKNIAKKGGDVARVVGQNDYAFPNGNPLSIPEPTAAAYVATDVKFIDCMRDGSHRKSVFARMPLRELDVVALSAQEKAALAYLLKFGFVTKV